MDSIYSFYFYFIFKLYNIVLVLPNIKMNPVLKKYFSLFLISFDLYEFENFFLLF